MSLPLPSLKGVRNIRIAVELRADFDVDNEREAGMNAHDVRVVGIDAVRGRGKHRQLIRGAFARGYRKANAMNSHTRRSK